MRRTPASHSVCGSTARAAIFEADRGRIRQLLNNLLTNSLEALDGRPDPVIMIETSRRETRSC